MGPALSATAPLAGTSLQEVDFTKILDERFDYVWFALRRFGVPSRDLDDIAHDVFLLVYQHLDKYRGRR
jgi:DNA-directed RNA polymerase specialized sigma24 family protein